MTNAWGTEQDSIKRLAKTKMKSQRGESWQMPNLGKNGAYAKIYQGFGQIFKWDDNRGILTTNCGFYDKWQNWQELKQHDKTGMSMIKRI